ncbi:MAG: hypothetical protein K2P93_08285 [Alphaproteobacteria bacterium]|nr:hypothetical protein [Alphaproteobacteria bacterium]
METSIFLAKALGIYLLIIGLSMLINGQKIKPLLINIINDPSLLFVTGFVALILGIILVIGHNIWVADWRVVITIVAWMTLLKGIIRIACPQFALDASKKWVENTFYYNVSMIFVLFIGSFLSYHGFF